MGKQKESSEIVTDRILKVATELFAVHGVDGVSIRQIAAKAGINHALIIRYFGTKDALVTKILEKKILELTSEASAESELKRPGTLAGLRELILNTLNNDKSTMKLIIRAELDGLSPSSYVGGGGERAANMLARWIASQQTDESLPDAKYIAMILIGSLFSLASIGPWLMTAVGLPPEDFEKREEDIIDVLLWIILSSTDKKSDKDAPA
jgi:AcrR family transcriptional regulator